MSHSVTRAVNSVAFDGRPIPRSRRSAAGGRVVQGHGGRGHGPRGVDSRTRRRRSARSWRRRRRPTRSFSVRRPARRHGRLNTHRGARSSGACAAPPPAPGVTAQRSTTTRGTLPPPTPDRARSRAPAPPLPRPPPPPPPPPALSSYRARAAPTPPLSPLFPPARRRHDPCALGFEARGSGRGGSMHTTPVRSSLNSSMHSTSLEALPSSQATPSSCKLPRGYGTLGDQMRRALLGAYLNLTEAAGASRRPTIAGNASAAHAQRATKRRQPLWRGVRAPGSSARRKPSAVLADPRSPRGDAHEARRIRHLVQPTLAPRLHIRGRGGSSAAAASAFGAPGVGLGARGSIGIVAISRTSSPERARRRARSAGGGGGGPRSITEPTLVLAFGARSASSGVPTPRRAPALCRALRRAVSSFSRRLPPAPAGDAIQKGGRPPPESPGCSRSSPDSRRERAFHEEGE